MAIKTFMVINDIYNFSSLTNFLKIKQDTDQYRWMVEIVRAWTKAWDSLHKHDPQSYAQSSFTSLLTDFNTPVLPKTVTAAVADDRTPIEATADVPSAKPLVLPKPYEFFNLRIKNNLNDNFFVQLAKTYGGYSFVDSIKNMRQVCSDAIAYKTTRQAIVANGYTGWHTTSIFAEEYLIIEAFNVWDERNTHLSRRGQTLLALPMMLKVEGFQWQESDLILINVDEVTHVIFDRYSIFSMKIDEFKKQAKYNYDEKNYDSAIQGLGYIIDYYIPQLPESLNEVIQAYHQRLKALAAKTDWPNDIERNIHIVNNCIMAIKTFMVANNLNDFPALITNLKIKHDTDQHRCIVEIVNAWARAWDNLHKLDPKLYGPSSFINVLTDFGAAAVPSVPVPAPANPAALPPVHPPVVTGISAALAPAATGITPSTSSVHANLTMQTLGVAKPPVP